jgi:plasmid stability protein
MRTTLSIDDDVLIAVKERAAREKRSVGEVLSELARQALVGGGRAPQGEREQYGFRPLPRRGRAVSNALVDQLRDEEGE